MKEIWKQYDEYHEVSNMGKIRISRNYNSYKKGYIFKQGKPTRKGYKRVNINGKQLMVHRLVAMLFIQNDNPKLKTEINHINFNRQDNRAENLEWVSHAENIRKSKELNSAYNFCRRSFQIKNITTGEIYDSAKQAATKLSVSTSAISNSIKRKNLCCGMKLQYTGRIIRYNKNGKLPETFWGNQ